MLTFLLFASLAAVASAAPADDPCTAHTRTGTKKTIVRFFDSRNSSNPIDLLQPAIWEEVQSYFGDYPSIAFVEIDVSICPQVVDDFPVKELPAYGMMSDYVLLGLCNAPDSFKRVWNFFFDFAPKSYKKLKGFTMYSSEAANITYPAIKGKQIGFNEHDEAIVSQKVMIIYYDRFCRYCNQLKGFWNGLVDTFSNEVGFLCLDCYDQRTLCAARGVIGYPTLFFFKDGNKTEYVGNEDINEMKQFIIANKT